ncbi:hypothetical protein [Tsukamurella paurometabola]|uniref:PknH-like extracellular domain-containing protein n=1 Tax=Tsukamurella paurometabola TaxID=2061 RepID=A0A3P8KU11_TSUPA|nr:hypothetical protein [Tsukamurella paurometabola]UEA83293.1 hypothetical protein LK411_00065 [Tsukamurella paurometabola]VDR40397.1 Uncharacterised protein [Tsukamurella paurometabola]
MRQQCVAGLSILFLAAGCGSADPSTNLVETPSEEILKFDLTNQKLVHSDSQVNGSLNATPLFQYRPQRMLVQQGQQAPENFDGGYGPAKCGPQTGWKQRGITLYTVTPNDKEVTNAAKMQDRELYEDVLIQEFFVFDSVASARGYFNTMKETLRKQCPDVDRTMGGRFPIQIKPAITSESEDRFTADSTVTPSRYDHSPETSGGNGSTGQQWRRVASVDRNIVTITDGAHYITKTHANLIQPTNITVAADLISNYIRQLQ